jgi:hypothetical protein
MKICNLLSIAVVVALSSANQAESKGETGAALAEAINNSQQMSDLVGCVFKSTREAIKSSGSFDKEVIIATP